MASISIVIPSYNEGNNIDALYKELKGVIKGWKETAEIIFVDDGSRDRSLEIIKGLNKKDKTVKALSFSRNFGHQTAVSAGIRFASGDAVIVMDGDLQDRPEELGQFISKWKEGYQVVYAVRRMKRKEGFIKKWASWGFYRLFSKMVSFDIPLDSGDFCLMDRAVVDNLNSLPESNRFVRGLRSWVGFRQVGVPVERALRTDGSPKYTFKKSLGLAANAIVSFSYIPLNYIAYFGFLVALFTFFASFFVIIHRIIGFKVFGYSPQDLPGYASLMLAILFLGGVQLLALGIVGQYIGRIYDETKHRPLFVVKERVGFKDKGLK